MIFNILKKSPSRFSQSLKVSFSVNSYAKKSFICPFSSQFTFQVCLLPSLQWPGMGPWPVPGTQGTSPPGWPSTDPALYPRRRKLPRRTPAFPAQQVLSNSIQIIFTEKLQKLSSWNILMKCEQCFIMCEHFF